MNTTKRQSVRRQGGSAFILVVVVTVLLAVIGLMFVMVARLGEMGSSAVVDNADLDAAVQTVVSRINTALVADLFGADGVIGSDGPHYTWPGVARGDDPLTGDRINPWLASLEPNAVDNFRWEHITNLSNPPMPVMWDRLPAIVPEYQPAGQIVPGHYADAAGDGVADSIWIRLPNASTSRGKPVFAAIRIIDNCAMLNLNTAHCFYQNPTSIDSFQEPWYPNRNLFLNEPILGKYSAEGRYITDVNYRHFLRGADLIGPSSPFDQNWYNIMRAKGFFNWVSNTPYSPEQAHNVVLNFIDAPVSNYGFFDIGDELEIRNRYKISSRVEARFERPDIANYTLDAGGGLYAPLRTPVEDDEALEDWKRRLNPANFEGLGDPPPSHPYYYDRRHISTFYSFDRPLRSGQYPLLEADVPDAALFMPNKAMPIDLRTADITDATTIVQLLYALREVYDAQIAAQIVVNLMDYVDSDNEVSILDTDGISAYIFAAGGLSSTAQADAIAENFGLATDDVIYGYERQPFISEIFAYRDTGGNVQAFGLELVNPYPDEISLDNWRITLGTSDYNLDSSFSVPAATDDTPDGYGRFTIWSGDSSHITINGARQALTGIGLNLQLNNSVISLKRPDSANPGQFLTVDQTRLEQSAAIFSADGDRSSRRDDNDWKFTNNAAYATIKTVSRLGQTNDIADGEVAAKGYQLPVANDGQPISRLADFIRVAFVSNTGGDDPNTITELIADAGDEADIRYDMEAAPELLDYICFLNRPDIGSLPGRININTAALHVIAAAIPPQLVMTKPDDAEHALYLAEHALYLAGQIVANRPYERVSDLLRINAFKKFAQTGTPNVGDQGVEGDFEERDWIVSRLANIFTVRSDTFTAYFLVRLGDDGPQRRMIAIFDRSQVWTPSDRPRLVALHPVPEAR